jgi:hypothetical protein
MNGSVKEPVVIKISGINFRSNKMNKLEKYKKLNDKIEKLLEEKESLKTEIVNKMKKMSGKNKDKEIKEGNYAATVTYAKSISWDVSKAEKLFLTKNMKECLTIKVDNKIVDYYEKNGELKTKELNKLRTVVYDLPRLYVNQITN